MSTSGRSPAGRAPVPWSWTERRGLAAILAIGLAFRVWTAARTPLWFDELFTLWMARHPLDELLPLLRGDVHPPLPTLLTAAWIAAGGEAEAWLKLLPITIGMLTLAAMHGFGRALAGPRVALAATAMLALHPMHIYFSQELRSYGLLTLALLLSTWMAWRWTESGRSRDAVGWMLAAALTLHTHYLGFLLIGILDAWVVARLWRTPGRLRPWLIVHGGVLGLLLPIAAMMPDQVALSRESWVPAPTPAAVVSLFRKLAFGALYMIPPLAGLAALALARPGYRRAAGLAWWMALAPIAAALAISFAGPRLFTERYMFFTVPYVCLLFAAGAAALRPPVAAAVVSAFLVVFAGRAAVLWRPLPEPVALREVSRTIADRLEPGDLLFCADTHSMICANHHLGHDRALLIVTGEPLPYYVGSALVPPARRVTPDSLRRAAVAGRRWWGLRTREGARPTLHVAALMDSLARGGRVQVEMVTLWGGREGMLDPAPAPPSRAGRATGSR